MPEIDNLRAEVECLKRQVAALRAQAKFFSDWHDTAHSSAAKRAVWWLMGFRLSSLGVWYRAPWNERAWQYEEADRGH